MHYACKSPELHSTETATVVNPLQLKLLEPIVVVTEYISIKPSGHMRTGHTYCELLEEWKYMPLIVPAT